MTLSAISTSATGAANAATLQGEINAHAGTGGVMELPDGHFLLDPVTLAPNVPLMGLSPYGTILLATQPSVTMLGYLATTSVKTNFEVSKIGFNNNGFSGVTGIKIDGNTSAIRCSKQRLLDLDFEGAFANAIYGRYMANSWIERIWASGCVNGITTDNCSDSDLASCKVQNGSGYGYKAIGGPGAFDEGLRWINCSTNGQAIGAIVDGQQWGVADDCSFTTCSGGAMQILNAASNWKFGDCEFSVAGASPAQANVVTSSASTDIQFDNSLFAIGTFGAVLRGTRNKISNSIFKANSNVDIYLDAANDCSVLGNTCDSTGVPWSIYENTPSNHNKMEVNHTKGSVIKTGANSTALNNTNY